MSKQQDALIIQLFCRLINHLITQYILLLYELSSNQCFSSLHIRSERSRQEFQWRNHHVQQKSRMMVLQLFLPFWKISCPHAKHGEILHPSSKSNDSQLECNARSAWTWRGGATVAKEDEEILSKTFTRDPRTCRSCQRVRRRKKTRVKTNKKRANARVLKHWYEIRFNYRQCYTRFLLNYALLSF